MDNIFTEFRKVEQTLQRLTIIAEQVNEGVVVVDFNGIARFVNTAMAKMHGYQSSKDLIGKKISVFHSEDQMKTDVFPMIEEVKRRGQLSGLIEHLRNDGTVFPTQTKMILLKDGRDQAVGLVVFVTDITEQIQVEKSLTKRIFELVTARENLQQQVSEHQQAIDRLQQQLEDKKAELSEAGEQLEQQIIERKQSEEKLKEYHEQLKGQVEQLTAELVTARERFEQQVAEHQESEEMTRENTEEAYGLIGPSQPTDEEELRSLAEMAKRLSK